MQVARYAAQPSAILPPTITSITARPRSFQIKQKRATDNAARENFLSPTSPAVRPGKSTFPRVFLPYVVLRSYGHANAKFHGRSTPLDEDRRPIVGSQGTLLSAFRFPNPTDFDCVIENPPSPYRALSYRWLLRCVLGRWMRRW